MRQSLFSETVLRGSVPLVRRTANGTVTGGTVDIHENQRDFQTVLILVMTGSMVDGQHAITLEQSVNGADWEVIPENARRGDALPAALDAAHGSQLYEVALDQPKRYLRGNLAVTSMPAPDPISGELPAGGTVGVFVQLGFPTSPPARV